MMIFPLIGWKAMGNSKGFSSLYGANHLPLLFFLRSFATWTNRTEQVSLLILQFPMIGQGYYLRTSVSFLAEAKRKQFTLLVHLAEFIDHLFCAKILPGAVYGINVTFTGFKVCWKAKYCINSYNFSLIVNIIRKHG